MLLIVGLFVLTAVQWKWLNDQGWSPIGRNPVQWPSVLLLGGLGCFASALILTAALALAALSLALWRAPSRPLSLGFGGMAIALSLVAIPPSDGDVFLGLSLHQMHDTGYLGLLILWTLCCTLVATRRSSLQSWCARLALLGLVTGTALTLVDEVASLGRYLVLLSVIGWVSVFSGAVGRERNSNVPGTEHENVRSKYPSA